MSHFTKIRIELKEKVHIKTALQELGYGVTENALLEGYGNKKTKVDILAEKPGVKFGLNYQDDVYELTADWYLNKEKEQSVISGLKQKYAFVCVKEQVEKMYGYRIENVVHEPNGNIRIQVENYL